MNKQDKTDPRAWEVTLKFVIEAEERPDSATVITQLQDLIHQVPDFFEDLPMEEI